MDEEQTHFHTILINTQQTIYPIPVDTQQTHTWWFPPLMPYIKLLSITANKLRGNCGGWARPLPFQSTTLRYYTIEMVGMAVATRGQRLPCIFQHGLISQAFRVLFSVPKAWASELYCPTKRCETDKHMPFSYFSCSFTHYAHLWQYVCHTTLNQQWFRLKHSLHVTWHWKYHVHVALDPHMQATLLYSVSRHPVQIT